MNRRGFVKSATGAIVGFVIGSGTGDASKPEMRRAWRADKCVEYYTWTVCDQLGIKREFWTIPQAWVRPICGSDNMISAYEVNSYGGGQLTTIPAEQISRVDKIVWTEVDFLDLRRGDLFYLSESDNKVCIATSDAIYRDGVTDYIHCEPLDGRQA